MTAEILVLLGAGVACAASAFADKVKVTKQVKQLPVKTHLSRVIMFFILSVQLTEMGRVVEHMSLANLLAALFLLVIWVAVKQGNEGDIL